MISDDLFHDGRIFFPSKYAQISASQNFVFIHTRTMQR